MFSTGKGATSLLDEEDERFLSYSDAIKERVGRMSWDGWSWGITDKHCNNIDIRVILNWEEGSYGFEKGIDVKVNNIKGNFEAGHPFVRSVKIDADDVKASLAANPIKYLIRDI